MTAIECHDEAERCRQQALAYLGQPEAPFLLRLAREFERLAYDERGRADKRIASNAVAAASDAFQPLDLCVRAVSCRA